MASSWIGADDWLDSLPKEGDDDGVDGLAALAELLRRINEERPDWQRDALCLEHPDVSFFPDTPGTGAAAKEVCRRCLVAGPCLDYALDNGISHGVWGGARGTALVKMRKRTRAA